LPIAGRKINACGEALTVEVVDLWTRRHASALRTALRMTNEMFAGTLGTAVRTVAKWNAQPGLVPVPELQRALDTELSRVPEDVQARFALLISGSGTRPASARHGDDGGAIDLRMTHDLAVGDALRWLDSHAGWPAGEARRRVRLELSALDMDKLETLAQRRGNVGRAELADALNAYYSPKAPYRFYAFGHGGQQLMTSVVTQPEWLDLALPLGQGRDKLTLDPGKQSPPQLLRDVAVDAAVCRLAETLATGTRMVNAPIYRLLGTGISAHGLNDTVALSRFVDYALTLDLLENELADTVSQGEPTTPGDLPLRDRYLPTARALTDVGSRLCVGGPLALLAIARSGRRRRGGAPDYVLLLQEQSGRVLNSARRLAVIPKAFHAPLADFGDDAQISATIEREMEEELFGRAEVDSTCDEQRRADPMHISSLSAPMRWLIDHADPSTWQIECTGFGINAMTGCFEVASLIVINDTDWWDEFGGAIQANWETEGLRRYSSLDYHQVAALICDPAWSNEGLFAFCQAIRRLSQVGGDRVNLPTIELEP
jgi:hypothetical protein